MGREVRMVPADWVHPTDGKLWNGEPRLVGLLDGDFEKDLANYNAEKAKWEEGFVRNYGSDDKWKPRGAIHEGSFEEWYGEVPQIDQYMPNWPVEQRTHLMMYETTSEGTPISPAFGTPKELARWLADNGASAFGSDTATYDQWLSTIKRGWAPSAVVFGGVMQSGVAGLSRDEA